MLALSLKGAYGCNMSQYLSASQAHSNLQDELFLRQKQMLPAAAADQLEVIA